MVINGRKYEIIEDYKDAFDEEAVRSKFTEYFERYDYVVGDWAYGNLRLKGFCKPNNPNFNEINDYNKKEEYLKEYCATDCKYFVMALVTYEK